MKNVKSLGGGSVLRLLLSFVLVVGLMPLPAYAGEEATAAEPESASEDISLASSDGYLVDWTTSGTCEWSIDSAGNLVVRPANGASEGTMERWSIPWSEYKARIKTATFEEGVSAVYAGGMFSDCCLLSSVNLSGLDTSKVDDMNYMFASCVMLSSLDLSSFDTSAVTSMDSMFSGCSSLASLDLSSFDTLAVTSMSSMFSDCSSLTSLDLSSFDTSNVTSTGLMFYGCSSLASLTLGEGFSFSGFNGADGERLCNAPKCDRWESWVASDGTTYGSDNIPNCKADTYKRVKAAFDFSKISVDTSDVTYSKQIDLTGRVTSDTYVEGTDYKYEYSGFEIGDNTITITELISGNNESREYHFNVLKGDYWSDYGSESSMGFGGVTPGTKLGDMKLSSGYSWQDDPETVLVPGNHTYLAMFTPPDTDHYNVVRDISISVSVRPYALKMSMLSVDTADKTWTGSAIQTPISGGGMVEGTDYDVEYANNVDPGTAMVVISGKGNYTGSLTYAFHIDKATPYYKTPDAVSANYGQTLADVSLPEGFSWQDGAATSVGSAGSREVLAVYTPEDTDHYKVVYDIAVTLAVAKAAPTYEAPTDLTATYGQTLADVALPCGFTWQDDVSTSVGEPGEHTFLATYTPADTANYNVVRDIPVTVTVSQPVYRMYNPITSEHLFTTDKKEYEDLTAHDWRQEGVSWTSPAAGKGVYRVYSPGLGAMAKMSHHYTSDYAEAANLVAQHGWQWDNGGQPIFYSAEDDSGNALEGASEVYRLYNGGLSAHHFTLDASENSSLISDHGWNGEGVGFYAFPAAG